MIQRTATGRRPPRTSGRARRPASRLPRLRVEEPAAPSPPPARADRLRQLGIAAAAALAAVNIWTGAPLLSLWAGSQVARDSWLSMGAIVVVVVVLAALVVGLVSVLTRLSAAYDRLTGHAARRQSPWLRSMRGERAATLADARFNLVERVVVVSVAMCALLFNVWFFVLAGSPLAGG